MSSSQSAELLRRHPILVFSAFAISCTVNDRHDDDFVTMLIYFVDDDIGPFEQFARTFNKTRTPHLREPWCRKPHDLLLDALDRLNAARGLSLAIHAKMALS